jgi:hypothetical protein
MYELADPRLNRGRPLTLDALLDLSAARVESSFLNEQEVRNDLVKAIANTYISSGRYKDAGDFLARAAKNSYGVFGLEQRAISGHAYLRANELDVAENVLVDVYSLVREGTSKEKIVRSQTAAYLGRVMQAKGNTDSSLQFADEALQLAESIRHEKSFDKDLGMVFNAVGLIYKGFHIHPDKPLSLVDRELLKKAKYAFDMSAQAFFSASDSNGRYEPLQQLPLSNIITVEYRLGNSDRAYEVARRVRENADQWTPDSPSSWLQSYMQLPALLAMQRRHKEAEIEYLSVYSQYKERGYADTAGLVSLIANIGTSYYHQDNCASAIKWLSSSLALSEKFYSEEHPIVENIIETIALCKSK